MIQQYEYNSRLEEILSRIENLQDFLLANKNKLSRLTYDGETGRILITLCATGDK